jgi:hypothetical protein
MDFERLKCGKSDLRLGLFGVEEHIPRKEDAVFFALYGEFITRKAETNHQQFQERRMKVLRL